MENITRFLPTDTILTSSGNTTVCEVQATEIIRLAHHLLDQEHLSLKLITATDERAEHGCFKIWYVFGLPKKNMFLIPFLRLTDTTEFPSLASTIHEVWNDEKKIRTFFGLTPVHHPDERAVILHENWPTNIFPLRKDWDGTIRPERAKGEYAFQKVHGEGIYEIPVGPIHAGIIEPGHFRFSVAGEEIMLLESRLGYTHKGSEKLFEQLSLPDKLRLSEKISGDSSFSHSLAFCQAIEQLADTLVPKKAQYLRLIYAELERLANHFGDIGAIMLDAGFNFGGSQGARLREIIMQINGRLTGSRFLRGVNAIGGVTKNINPPEQKQLAQDLLDIRKEFSDIIAVAENSVSLLNRLKGTGKISQEVALEHGIVGVAARAVGIPTDTRRDYPYAAYDEIHADLIPTEPDGDVYARFRVRIKEVYHAIQMIQQALQQLPEENRIEPSTISLKKNALAISCVEGWRGEIVYFVTTDSAGNISRVAPRDPSWINWVAVGHAGLGNVVPDFPLINKSFNLSYSGNDL